MNMDRLREHMLTPPTGHTMVTLPACAVALMADWVIVAKPRIMAEGAP